MKTFKYILPFLATVACMIGCNEKDEVPEAFFGSVSTKPAEAINNNSATLKFETQNSSYKGGFYYGNKPDLNDAQTISSSGGTIHIAKIENLTPLTTYYYQGFIEDKLGSQIKGEIKTFTTTKELRELWNNIPNSKYPGMNFGYHSCFNSDNYFYLWCGIYEDILGDYNIVKRSEWKYQFWRYNIKSNKWENTNTYVPGNSPLVHASIYAGTGEKGYFLIRNTSGSYYSLQFWLYDGQTNAWTSLPDFPSVTRYNPPIFVYNEFLYIMDFQRKIWVYDPIKVTWTEIIGSQYPGKGIYDLAWFHYENKLFIGLGRTNNMDWPYTDFWELEVESYFAKWTERKDFIGKTTGESNWNCFELNQSGYFIDGKSKEENSWTYDIQKDTWNFIEDKGNKYEVCNFKANNIIYLYNTDAIWRFDP